MGVSGSDEQAPGRVVAGRYHLESVLGRGGMGVVWRATDTLIERTVALKELRAPTRDDAEFVERALREARNAGRLNHPAIVAVHDVIAPTGDDDSVYIVMEYVEAPTLAEMIDQNGPLPPHRVAALGVGILDALEAAHAMGVVHRDIKPGNALVREGDRVKLTDFGIALAAEDTRLTRSGVMGTQAYLAPECFDAGQVGPASDLWALGATLFHAVAGRAPFERDTATATLRAILFEDTPPPPCPPPLATAITGLLTRPVAQRLTSGPARQLLQEATTARPAPPTTGTNRPPWQAQATTFNRPPTPPPPRPAAYPTGPVHATGPVGPPPPQRNNSTPWIIGGALTAAAALVIVMVVALGGGSDSDGGGGSVDGGGSGGEASGYTEEMHDQFVDECLSQFSGITIPEVGDVGDTTCECVWGAVVENIPADVYRTALTSANGDVTAMDFPSTEMDADMTAATQECLPELPTTTP